MANTSLREYSLIWNGIKIHIIHIGKRWGVIDHIEIRTVDPENAPLPITETGYKSHFIQEEYLAEYDNAKEYVLAWLDHESKKAGWLAGEEKRRQYSLF